MSFPTLQDFRSSGIVAELDLGLQMDSGLLLSDLANGVPVHNRDILDVAVNARALHTLATLTCRELDRIEPCYGLWSEVTNTFEALCAVWDNNSSDDPQIQWLRSQLFRLRDLARDRCELYRVSNSERRTHAGNRTSTGKHDLTEPEPELEPEQTRRLLTSVEKALDRRERRKTGYRRYRRILHSKSAAG